MTGNRHRTWLNRMMVLAVTTARSRQSPTIRLYHFDRVSNLHLNYSVQLLC